MVRRLRRERHVIEWNRIVLLSREAGAARLAPLAPEQRFLELHAEDCERLVRTYRQYGRKGDPQRLLRRFRHGFRCFAVEEDTDIVAWFWAIHGVPRYLDETAWRFELGHDLVWARDAFVAPARRGRRLVAAMMDAATIVDSRPRRFLSDVSAGNILSLRAHAALGFRRFATVQSLVFGRRLILRGRPPGGVLPAPTGLRTERRWLWLSDEELAWHREQIA